MTTGITEQGATGATPIHAVTADGYRAWADAQPAPARAWLEATGFEPKPGRHAMLPDAGAGLAGALVIVEDPPGPWALAALPDALPAGTYRVEAGWTPGEQALAAIGWSLACYRFTRYRRADAPRAVLALDGGVDASRLDAEVAGITLARDLINTPASDLDPERLGDAIADLGAAFDAQVERIAGDDLLTAGFPAVHAVGRAASARPEVIDLGWGDPQAPQVTLIGKGVCFDSGGLDIKGAANMRLMKKDMGGAAHAAALARMVMATGLPVRLRLLVGAVENAISGNAYRPGDVLSTRKGTTVEVDNTDAEGRIVLSDLLALAGEESPDLVVDFSTLTGAARVALGTEVPVLFCNDDEVAEAILATARTAHDPVWRLPLHAPYRELLDSRVADMTNSASTPFGGAITAALFLEHFVPDGTSWAHYDLMAWNAKGRPGRPEGGEAMGLRAMHAYLRDRFAA